ncbi:helix-turn-helix domain-containing protein [Pseudoalteromonas sp. OOF1S-7]|uniref:helix-turn-helix domain-containing protein n=1 Tax=Pseudoalteromonas sp. OOF1S-7 TaxID=2917757 RepID=UPI001EF681AD|nr:helix-turn-helix domain-containing protein [Pseudoalteromonas sp. OOF1S-7]MCG7535394.1 helix-turn-helix domain-containing protein [Pseudoalteromonas sp. OOF1S-7]
MTRLLQHTLSPQLKATLSYYAPGSMMPAHRHDHAQLSVLLSGGLREQTEQAAFDIATPGLCFKPRHILHSDQYGAQGALIFSFTLSPELLIQFDKMTAPRYQWQSRLNAGPRARQASYLQALYQGQCDTLNDLFWDTLSECGIPQHTVRERQKPDWLVRAKKLLDEAELPLSLSELATQQGVHPVYFSRAFKKYFHISASAYQQQLQLSKAMRSMTQGVPLSDCAFHAGFSDQSHMNRTMMSRIGLSPGKLQRLFHSKTG